MVSVLNEIRPELDLKGQNADEEDPVTMIIPASIKRRGARKYIKTPQGYDLIDNRKPYYDETLIKAVVRGHAWLEELDKGVISSSCDIAERDGVDNKYVRKALKTTTLAPDIIDDILNGRQPKTLTFNQLKNVPLLWAEQREQLGFRQAA
ncbi:MAG: hypothetical protein CL570_06190 [Alphaproteobacteria bacterium]|nr:hypothetical protein [Alphaproteobacteria bacterium]|tara:strand:- start:439 stop:888 length:450 start_codon:yes stop_codon:yes gene_type:complete